MKSKHVLIMIGVIVLAAILYGRGASSKKTSDPCKAYRGIATRAAKLNDNELAAQYIVDECSKRYSDMLEGLECAECCEVILGL